MWTGDYTTCGNCGDVVHRGAVDKDDLCPDCHDFNEEGLL